jgi:hypothetical protein
MTTEATTARGLFQTALDVCIATPCRLAVIAAVMPAMAVVVGVARGFHDVAGYIRGEGGGLRLLASAHEEEQRAFERRQEYLRTLPAAPFPERGAQ